MFHFSGVCDKKDFFGPRSILVCSFFHSSFLLTSPLAVRRARLHTGRRKVRHRESGTPGRGDPRVDFESLLLWAKDPVSDTPDLC